MTREEAINHIRYGIIEENYHLPKELGIEACEMAIKALEQESVFDKIRAEIVDTTYVDSLIFGELIDFRNGKISADDVIEEFNRVARLEVLKILDKYKIEGEE